MPRAPTGTPLYVHLPFCVTKCPYCDFFSVEGEGRDIDGTLDAILAEARQRAPEAPRTVFLGGGTPSYLTLAQLDHFLNRLHEVTGFRETAREVTAECNPESLDEAKARALVELGVRRLSIGFQSLSEDTLRLFGRAHSPAQSYTAFAAARSAGADSVSVDMIYAAPGQTPEQWTDELGRVLALEPDHLSAYNLTYEKGTPFESWLQAGRLVKTPEETELAMFDIARTVTAAHGLEAYEISNYARPGEECLHNITYWNNGPYVGIGPSAVSRVGELRFGNERSLSAYRSGVAKAGEARAWEERLEPEARLAETWWLGLRLAQGVDPAEARRTAGCSADPDPALPVADELVASGHLERAGERYRLTPVGRPLADALARVFLDRLSLKSGSR